MDPAYPVYADANVMAGRSGPADSTGRYADFVYLPCTAENDFQPALPDRHVDLIYLCYPNNPTGAVMTREALRRWVDYARAHEAVIVYDAAYEAYIRDPEIPRSIYEVEGARAVAIESRSFSKSAGFTGLRMAYTVVPRELEGRTADGRAVSLHQLWLRRQSTKSNGPPYVIQRAAAAVYTPEGQAQVRSLITHYMENARVIREGLLAAGLTVYGGRNAPYIWIRTPAGVSSWDFFDRLLAEAQVIGVPGSGFGPSGEGYFRVTAFGSRDASAEAVERIAACLRLAGAVHRGVIPPSTRPRRRRMPSRIVSGCGGQPGMNRSTGSRPGDAVVDLRVADERAARRWRSAHGDDDLRGGNGIVGLLRARASCSRRPRR